jgi:hypothetical protein
MDVRDRLRQLMDEIPPLPQGDPEATFGQGRRRVRRRRTLAAGGSVVVGLVAVALVVLPGAGPRLPLISDTPDAPETGVVQVPAGWVTITAGEIAVSVPPDWEIDRRFGHSEPPEGVSVGGPCISDLYRFPGAGTELEPRVPVAVVYDRPTDGVCPAIGFSGPPPRPGLVLFETIRGTVDGVEDQPGWERVDIEQRAVRDRIGQLQVWRTVDDEQSSDLEPSGIVSYVPVELQGGLWVSHPDDHVVQQILTTARPADDAASDDGSEPGPPADDPAPQPPAGEQSPADGADGLVDSQATVPQEFADEFADIATTAGDATEVWQRFRLSGDTPQVDFDTTALLFVGFGESGSCPARFDGLAVDGERVEVALGWEGGPVCTDDYNPRTFVLEVSRDELPDGGFELTVDGRVFVLSSVPLSEPPSYDDAIVARLTAEDPQLDLDARPQSVPVGESVELVLVNRGEVAASTGSWPMTLHRWDQQRWLPAGGVQDWGQPNSNIEEQTVTVEPGEEQVVAHVHTEALDDGWYSVSVKLQLGGRGGAVETHESFEVGMR